MTPPQPHRSSSTPPEQHILAMLAGSGLIVGGALTYEGWRRPAAPLEPIETGTALAQVFGPLLFGVGVVCLVAYLVVGALRR